MRNDGQAELQLRCDSLAAAIEKSPVEEPEARALLARWRARLRQDARRRAAEAADADAAARLTLEFPVVPPDVKERTAALEIHPWREEG